MKGPRVRKARPWLPVAFVMGTLASATSAAQTTRGAGGATRGVDSGTIIYEASGIRVIQRFATTSEIVVANLYLLGGVRQVTAENAGLELLLLEASERGTKTYSQDRLRRSKARLGTRILTSARADWTSIGMQATRATFDSTWKIFTSRVTEPVLDSAGVEIVRAQLLTAVRQRQDSPDALVEFLADSFAFAGHAYALPPAGTERSLARITAAELRRYHSEQFVKSRMLLVVVGNVPRSKIEQLVQQSLGRLGAGSYRWALPDTLPRSRATVLTVNRPLPTNYILGLYAGPPAGSKDYQALRVAAAVLAGQFFGEVRSRRNLTYAVDAPFMERAIGSGGLYVTTSSPDLTLDVMRRELEALKGGLVDARALERLVQQFFTQYFLDNESAATQADLLARAQLYRGDFRTMERFMDDLHSITPDDIRRAAQRYMRDVKFVFIGEASRAPIRTMERF